MIRTLKHWFSIHPVNLAVFRVCLGLVIIWDLLIRWGDRNIFYTSEGLYPLQLAIDRLSQLPANFQDFTWSIYFFNDASWWTAVLMIITIICAGCLSLGWKTRLMTILCWILLVSLDNRNELLLHGGDILLRLLLFWSIFLPLGHCHSIDSALSEDMTGYTETTKKIPYFSTATAAIMFQVILMYLFTTLAKLTPLWIENFNALQTAFSMPLYAKPLAQFLSQFDGLLSLMTPMAVLLEALIVFSLLIPKLRGLGVLLTIILHLFIFSTLEVGLFPWVSLTASLLFVPPAWWQQVFNFANPANQTQLHIYYDGDCNFCKKGVHILRELFLPQHASIVTGQSNPQIFNQMDAKNSWVVVDENNHGHTGFKALIVVFQSSPILKLFVPLMTFIQPLGEVLYKLVANNRYLVSRFFLHLKFTPLKSPDLPPLASAFVGLCLIVVVTWNLATAKILNIGYPQHWQWFTVVFRLDQQWGMFSENALTGNLKASNLTPLFPKRIKLPLIGTPVYPNFRWQKFEEHLYRLPYNKVAKKHVNKLLHPQPRLIEKSVNTLTH